MAIECRLRHWDVDLSYLVPPRSKGARSWRTNLHIGVLATTITDAIAAAVTTMPKEGSEPFVISAHHKGSIDAISFDADTSEAIVWSGKR